MKSAIRNTIFAGLLIALASTSWAALPTTFIATQSLSAQSGKVVVVDVRNIALYLLGHVKGAIQISKDDFLETRRGVKSLVPSPKAWEELLSKNGITPDTTVVVYAEDKDPYAARFVWSLRYYGHENAYVLDGGIEKWKSEGLPTELLPTSPLPVKAYKIRGGTDSRVDADTLLTRIDSPSTVIWDSRSRDEYLGKDVRADRGGHIPGALHLDWRELQTDLSGVKVLKSEEEIRSLLTAKGITADKEVFVHCQTGIRSAYVTMVLLGYGYPKAANYDGSWIEWGNEQSLPVEQGDIRVN